jgi:beta-galactosidase
VTLWGEDEELGGWLADNAHEAQVLGAGDPGSCGAGDGGTRGAGVSPATGSGRSAGETPAPRDTSVPRDVILVGAKPPASGGEASFADLIARIQGGATAVFLCPQVFAEGDNPARFLPVPGTIAPINGWLYLKDEWTRRHPIFAGLPSGGLMDYTYYREIIPDLLFMGLEGGEAVAGAMKTSQDYSAGLMVAVQPLGAGRIILNTLLIRENLGRHPAAERLLRNMLNYAAAR